MGVVAPARAQLLGDNSAQIEANPAPPADPVVDDVDVFVDDAAPLTTAQVRQTYPDVEIAAIPGLGVGIFIGPIVPFQLFALGVSLEAYVVPRVRLNLLGTVGASYATSRDVDASFYGEAGVGVVVARWFGETSVEIPPPLSGVTVLNARRMWRRAMMPLSHSLEVEGGILTVT